MNFKQDLFDTIDTDKNKSGLQIDAQALSKYFNDKNSIAKAGNTWRESTDQVLGKLETADKQDRGDK